MTELPSSDLDRASPPPQRSWPEPSSSGRPRALLTAYVCDPDRGSEAGVGWNRVVQTARVCDTWVICEGTECRPPIARREAARGPIPGLTFHYVDLTPWERRLMRLPGTYWVGYNLWHRRAFELAQRLHREHRFDLVHQVNLCGYREPGYLWQLDAPFVWGPVGGVQNYPWNFLTLGDLRGAFNEIVRNTLNPIQFRFSRRVRQATRRAAVLLCANSTTRDGFARVHGRQGELLLETGLPRLLPPAAPRQPPTQIDRARFTPGRPLRILWSGRLLTWKALHLLLGALARVPRDLAWELQILGNGPRLRRWRHAASRLRVADRITWLGTIPHAEIPAKNAWADVLVFTSLRDTSGNVILDAFAVGTPVITLDHQGAGDMVTPECGIKVPVTTPVQVAEGLAEALTRLARDPDLWSRLSAGALERGRYYLWDANGEAMARVYERVLGKTLTLRPAQMTSRIVSAAHAERPDVHVQKSGGLPAPPSIDRASHETTGRGLDCLSPGVQEGPP